MQDLVYEVRRIPLPRTRVNKVARLWLNLNDTRVRAYTNTTAKAVGDMAAGSSLESWVGQYVSVELAADPGSEGSIAILRGGGLEARLEGVSEYGLMLLMVRYDELEDKRIEYLRFYPWGSWIRNRSRPKTWTSEKSPSTHSGE